MTARWNVNLVLVVFVFAFACVCLLPCNTVSAQPATKIVQLNPVDSSGVYALPEGACLKYILLNGKPAMYVLVKDGTEVDVWAARPNSKVEAVIYK